MDAELAKAALVFLGRADLKGGEVPAFISVVQALEVDANAKPAVAEDANVSA